MRFGFACALLALGGLTTMGCGDGGEPDAGTDSGGPVDAGCPMVPALDEGVRPTSAECPTEETPAPEEQMGTCCWRDSNADQQDAPEMRLTYVRLVAPVGSMLSSMTLGSILNRAMQLEDFNWLFRVEGADA